MSTYREAIHHARRGGTIRLGAKVIRQLTQEEANAHALEHNPFRRVALETYKDKDGNDHQRPIVKNGKIVIETYGDVRPGRLGLWDVTGEPFEFSPTDDDMYAPIERDEDGHEKARVLRSDWVREGVDDITPEAISPDAIDEALGETEIDHEANPFVP